MRGGVRWLWLAGLGLLAVSACLTPPRPGQDMMITVFPNAALVRLPEGGCLMMLCGTGLTEQAVEQMRKDMYVRTGVRDLLVALGLKPRVDWLIVAPLNGAWESRLEILTRRVDVRTVFLPFTAVSKSELIRLTPLDRGINKVAMHFTLEGSQIRCLDDQRSIDVMQSVSGTQVLNLLAGCPGDLTPLEGSVCLSVERGRQRILLSANISPGKFRFLEETARGSLRADVLYAQRDGFPGFVEASAGAVQATVWPGGMTARWAGEPVPGGVSGQVKLVMNGTTVYRGE